MRALLHACGVVDEDRASRLIRLANEAHSHDRWNSFGDVHTADALELSAFEESASAFFNLRCSPSRAARAHSGSKGASAVVAPSREIRTATRLAVLDVNLPCSRLTSLLMLGREMLACASSRS